MNLDERLEAARTDFQQLRRGSDEAALPRLLSDAPTRPNRRTTVIAVAAVVALVAGVVGVVAVRDVDGDSAEVATAPNDQGPLTSPLSGAAVDQATFATDLPTGASDQFSTIAWTGDSLIVWGGEQGANGPEDQETDWETGATYDVATDTWTALPLGPLGPRGAPTSVWTGTELVVCCAAPQAGLSAGAAYSPSAGTWRSIAPSPIDYASYTRATWTGTEMLVVGGDHRGGLDGNSLAMAYDPATDTWRELAAPPYLIGQSPDTAWQDGTLVVWPRDSHNQRPTALLSFDIATNQWTEIPVPDAIRPVGGTMASTSRGTLLWGVGPDDVAVAAWLPTKSTEWEGIAVPALPPISPATGVADSALSVANGDDVIIWTSAIGSDETQTPGLPTRFLTLDTTNLTWIPEIPSAALPGNNFSMVPTTAGAVLLNRGQAVFVNPRIATQDPSAGPESPAGEDPLDGPETVGELIDGRFLIGGTRPDGTLAFTARQLDGSQLTFAASPEIADDTKDMHIALRGWVTCSPQCGDAELTATVRLPAGMTELRTFTRDDGIVVREVSDVGRTFLIFDLGIWYLRMTTHGVPTDQYERWATSLPLTLGPTRSPVVSDGNGFRLMHDATPTVELQNGVELFVVSNGTTCDPTRNSPPGPPGPDTGTYHYATSCPDPTLPGLNFQGDAREVERFYEGLRFES